MGKILIIEDDAEIAEIERYYLFVNGFSAKIARDGKIGIEMAKSEEFDLILLDLMLPEIDGFTVLKKLRESFTIPILMVKAKEEDIDMIKGLSMGADDYITKPFSPNILVARVKANIAQYKRLKENGKEKREEISFGNIRIQTSSHRVFVKDKEVQIKNKEY